MKLALFLNFFFFLSLSQAYSPACSFEQKIDATTHHHSTQSSFEVGLSVHSSAVILESAEERTSGDNKEVGLTTSPLEPLVLAKTDTFQVVNETHASRYQAYYSLFTNSPPHTA